MKPLFHTLIFLLLSTNCFSQATETKEQFINEVYRSFVDSTFTQYYLSDKCRRVYLDVIEIKYYRQDFGKNIPDTTLLQLIQKATVDTLPMKWDWTSLVKAKCATYAIDSIYGYKFTRVFHVNVKAKWSKAKQEKAVKRQKQKQISKEEKELHKIPLQERVIYHFSRPVFDDRNEYAIIAMGKNDHNNDGGCIYLFKKINGRWKMVAYTSCWES